ncbi:FecR domain-containing protein [uncultured Chitinophaga sp.]|uniref:FecR family protein n=1 Tax=uncultured Chitinophaga sp. TaxID=339340 RepID=UPI0025CD2202|nr:FecR domain-containing protein [uncultured Chitinophaga sp.]
MDKEKITRLIARKLSGEATPEEIKELDDHLREHPEDAYFLSIMDDYWPGAVPSLKDGDADGEAHFQHILATAAREEDEVPAPQESRRYYLRKTLAAAAVLTGLVCGGWWYFRNKPAAETLMTETVAKPGAKSRVLLSDGTIVWLNSGSRIVYPTRFSDSVRAVELEGEAYFDVAKMPNRPFLVRTRDLHVRVLGTVFNIKCYPDDLRSEATLISGAIQVSKTGETQSALLLHPHEKVVVDRQAVAVAANTPAQPSMVIKHIKVSIPDTSMVETAWVYNKLVFDGEDFREIATEMERWYNVKITINDPAVAAYRFHAKFENERMEEVLEALQLSLPFTFKINNNEVNIYK